jgi:hypothetical protein
MEFCIKALLEKIDATVIPELPADFEPKKLAKYVSARLAQLVDTPAGPERKFLTDAMVQEAKRIVDELLAFSTYFANISGEKFASLPAEQQSKLEALSIQVKRSCSICDVYTETIFAVAGSIKN